LYDTLIEEFNGENTRTRVPNDGIRDAIADADPAAPSASTETTPQPLAGAKSSGFSAIDDSDGWSDDPVRMYLTQMGEIPLLTRQEEITLAKRIEDTRRQFRTKLLESDYVIKVAYKILVRVYRGELPFDRTVQVSVTDRLEKEQILGRIGHNLKTMSILLKQNRHDFLTAYSKSASAKKRKEAWDNLARRRRRCVRLIEELGLRTHRIENHIRMIEDFSSRVDELQVKISKAKKNKTPEETREAWVQEMRGILLACQLATGCFDRQKISQPWFELPGLDSRR